MSEGPRTASADMPPPDRWSVLVIAAGSPSKEARGALFDAICEAVVKVERRFGVEMDVFGQPLKDLGLPDGY